MELLQAVNLLLNQPNTFIRNRDGIISNGNQIIKKYEATETLFGENPAADELRPILASIGEENSPMIPEDIDIVLSKVLKVLLRKPTNRSAIGKKGMSLVVKAIARLVCERKLGALTEMCNVVLNACYDTVNTQLFIEAEGLSLLFTILRTKETILLASALGVMQGLCYIPIGRQRIRQEVKVVEKIAVLLKSENDIVRARAVGIFHNLSVDIVSIIPISSTGCLSLLAQLLRDSSSDICIAAAGTLQNLSRDGATRQALIEMGAVDYISDLLFASDVTCQVAAVGTMLNLMGPNIAEEEQRCFQLLLTDAIVLGAVRSCIFELDEHIPSITPSLKPSDFDSVT